MLRNTTSAIGPSADPRADTPVFRRSTTCCVSQSATLASAGSASDGAYHLSIGLTPPLISSDPLVAPNTLRPPWQALQWPSPRTR